MADSVDQLVLVNPDKTELLAGAAHPLSGVGGDGGGFGDCRPKRLRWRRPVALSAAAAAALNRQRGCGRSYGNRTLKLQYSRPSGD